MIVSDEPGLYLEGRFGIRLENLVLCRRGAPSTNFAALSVRFPRSTAE